MPETASALAIGATPPTSATSGTGIWIDRTGLYSLSAGAFQIKIDASTGKLHTGGTYGAILDAVGISLKSGGIIGTGIGWYDISSGDRTAYVGGAMAGQPAIFVQATGTAAMGGASADLSSSTTGYSSRTVYLSLVSNATPTAYLYLGGTLATKIDGNGLSAKRIVLNSYATNPADTSRTFSDTSTADITGFTLSVVVPQTGCDVLIGWSFRTWSSSSDYSFHLTLMQGTRTVRTYTDVHRYTGQPREYIGMTYLDRNQAAGTYTYKLVWAAAGGTGHTCYANSGHMYAVVSGVTVS